MSCGEADCDGADVVGGLLVDGVEAANGLDGGANGRGDHGVGVDGEALRAADGVVVHLGLEGAADVGRGAAESDKDAAGRDPVDVQALGLEPAGDGGDVLVGEAEALAHFGGGEPVVIVGRGGVLLVGEKLLEGLPPAGASGREPG